jgi:TolB-like protein/DNA-binding winged helix-turn-helix (wHTH) protein/Tfp pilus assembly protein PilF
LDSARSDELELDLTRYELRRGDSVLKLEKIPMELLILLVEHKDWLVGREEIIERLWGKDVFLDTEQGINTAIRKIRQALHDDPAQPRFVQTVVGKGYRFTAPINVVKPAAEGSKASTDRIIPAARAHQWWIIGMAIAALLAVVVAALVSMRTVGWPARLFGRTEQPIGSIAVLPLENLSGNPAEEYFADGMTEALITDLAKIRALRVISRTSVMRYKGMRKPLPEIARELNVDAVVEGAVMRSGDRVRITAQLIYAPTDRHLWAESYDRDAQDILALQSEVAGAIAREVSVTLTPDERIGLAHRPPVSMEAYDAYLRGRYYWNQRTEAGLQKGIEFFQRAIELDPTNALAYSGLADCYTGLGYGSYLAPKDSFPAAKKAAARAIELDATLAEPHASLAYARLYYDWDWAEAEREFQRALALNANYATAHHWYSVYLTAMGRPQEALVQIKEAQKLDPLSLIINTDIGFESYYSGRYDEAVEQLRPVIAANPNFPLAHLWLGRTYQQKQMYEEALTEYKQAESVLRDWPVTMAAIGNVYGLSHQRPEAFTVLGDLKELSKRKYVTAYGIALVYAGLGKSDQAFAWLDRGYEERTHWLVWLKLDPRWDSLRSDSRFQDLLHRMNLAQ